MSDPIQINPPDIIEVVFENETPILLEVTGAGSQGEDGADGKTIVSAAFVGDDIVFTMNDDSIVTLVNAKITLKGTDGTDGTDGKTVRNGSGTPDPGLGVNGDFYIDTTAIQIYGPKTGDAWGSGVNIVGPEGDPGDPGIDGKTILNGAGVPSSGLGVDGDFYIDTTANEIYGPKSGGVWGSGIDMIGPEGDPGDPGMSRFTFILHRGENATVGVNKTNTVIVERACTISKAYAYAVTGPTGSALIFDINVNGTTIWSTQGNRLQIAAGQNSGTQTSFNTTALAEGDLITIDIDQIGSTISGADITVVLKVE